MRIPRQAKGETVSSGWEFWIDRGGTFTDIVGYGPDGQLIVEKLLSEDPEHDTDASLQAIRRILAKHAGPASTTCAPCDGARACPFNLGPGEASA